MIINISIFFITVIFSILSMISNAFSKKYDPPIIYWANVDASVDRRIYMEEMLGKLNLPNYRIKGVTPADIEIVDKNLLNYTYCEIRSASELFKPRVGYQGPVAQSNNRKYRIVELCGRPKNILRELAGTLSHLNAIHAAIYSSNNNPYAVILEDDVHISFDIDFTALAQSAPKDFLILQLLISNENVIDLLWKKYKSNNGQIWTGRRIRGPTHLDFWCAGAYIINRAAIKSYIDSIIHLHPNGTMDLRIIAGYHRPCFPLACCDSSKGIPHHPPCIFSPRGFSADDFIYALGPTHALNIPLIAGAGVGNFSTIHQHHIKRHISGFIAIEGIIRDLYDKSVLLPSFAKTIPGSVYGVLGNTSRLGR